MPATLQTFDEPGAFAISAMQFLLAVEAQHCVMIGLVSQAVSSPGHWDRQPTLALVERDGVAVAAAIRTPPFQPVISRVDDPAAIPLLVEHFVQDGEVTGVSGDASATAGFAEEWTRRTGQSAEMVMPQRIYDVREVVHPHGVPGRFRPATESDRPLLIQWMAEFITEAFAEGTAVPGQAERGVEARLHGNQSGLAFWEDGEPVSMIGYSGPTPNGIRIGPVYTPTRFRRRGYATALTAHLSQALIDEGREFCALFTDLINPTSNHIYQEIGYRVVGDAAVYRFSRP